MCSNSKIKPKIGKYAKVFNIYMLDIYVQLYHLKKCIFFILVVLQVQDCRVRIAGD